MDIWNEIFDTKFSQPFINISRKKEKYHITTQSKEKIRCNCGRPLYSRSEIIIGKCATCQKTGQ